MRYAREHKGETKARIVDAASALFRRKGIDAVGIASVMEAAAMTHGGFYAHFDSKEALIREGILAAGAGTAAEHRAAAASAPPGFGLARIIDRYLSRAHRDRPETGCVIPAFVAEIARHSKPTRNVFTQRVRGMLGLLGDFAETPEREATALGVMATLVGALSLARAVDDPELADAFLREGRRAAQALASARP